MSLLSSMADTDMYTEPVDTYFVISVIVVSVSSRVTLFHNLNMHYTVIECMYYMHFLVFDLQSVEWDVKSLLSQLVSLCLIIIICLLLCLSWSPVTKESAGLSRTDGK